jgi:hypothetical protein
MPIFFSTRHSVTLTAECTVIKLRAHFDVDCSNGAHPPELMGKIYLYTRQQSGQIFFQIFSAVIFIAATGERDPEKIKERGLQALGILRGGTA